MQNRSATTALLAVMVFVLGFPELPAAQSGSDGFRVSPPRIVLNDGEFGTIKVQNTGDSNGEFSVELRYMVVDEDGNIEQVSAEDVADEAWPLRRNLRFGPRRFVLEPGERQAIHLATRFDQDQPDGEYRAYVAVVRTPDDIVSADQENQTENVGLRLRFKRATAVPVRVFKGDLDIPVVEIEEMSVQDASSEISLRLQARGNRTVAGNVDVYHYREDSDEGQKINTRSPRVAIYPELPFRNLTIPLQPGYLDREEGGALRIVYTGEEDGEEYIYIQEIVEL